MDWREMVRDKLMSPQEAVQAVKPGDRVVVAPLTCTPFTLCQALYERRQELKGLRLEHIAGLFPWLQPGEEDAFELHDLYATAADREMVNAGHIWYHPYARWLEGVIPEGFTEEPDVYMVPVSPPDRHGYCSFGTGVWLSPTMCQRAKTVIAEVHEDFIRTGGTNYVHISQIHRLCAGQRPTGRLPLPQRSDEEVYVAEVICTLVASELVKDRDTIQIGIGTVSAAQAVYLQDKHDLGIQTEMITGGMAELVRLGVATGKYKTLFQGKVIGGFIAAVPEEELALIDGNPAFEMYEFNTVDDIRMLIRHENLIAINNALLVDLTGQVASETIGPRVWTGVGGQTAFAIAAQYSKGGRSVFELPSSHIVDSQRVSRIVPALPEATVVTVPRTLVDYVVTEHGIATLRGKSVRERIGELIAVAHPDFRGELKREAKRLYKIEV